MHKKTIESSIANEIIRVDNGLFHSHQLLGAIVCKERCCSHLHESVLGRKLFWAYFDITFQAKNCHANSDLLLENTFQLFLTKPMILYGL